MEEGNFGDGGGFRKMGGKGMMHIFAHHQIFTWHSWTNNGCIFKKSKSGNIWNHQSYHSLSNRIHSVAIETISYFLRNGSEVFSCLMDMTKAFDLVKHSLLFKKMLEAGLPDIFVRLLLVTYTLYNMQM